MFWYTIAMSQPMQSGTIQAATNQRSRMVVLGLDGLPHSLARTLAKTGKLPNLARLALDTDSRAIRAELPDLSPVNWTSFYTASGPEEHGVFGFTRISPATYEMALADFNQVAVPTIFDLLGEAGFASRVLNLPNTYPARPVKGTMLVAGFVAPDLKGAVHPPFLTARLNAAGYQIEADTTRGAAEPEYLFSQIRAMLRSRRQALEIMWPDLGWDVFTCVLTETDRLFHFFFDAVTDTTHPLHTSCMELLTEWDVLLGYILDLYDRLPHPKRLMALADHGFTRLQTEVDINAWLRHNGYLHTASTAMQTELDATGVLPEARAFALDPGRIYLHTAQRFSRGRLNEAQAADTAHAIRSGLMALRYEGKPVIRAVHTADDLYNGPMRPYAPDLICEAHSGFDLKAKFDRDQIFGFFGRSGSHTADDAFFYDSQGAAPRTLRETGQLVLKHFGIAPHNDNSLVSQRGTGIIHTA